MSGDDLTTESWLGLVDFPGYDVSDRGRVRSYWRKGGWRYGMILGETPKFLKLIRNNRGYLEVNLRTRAGKIRTRTVGQLVLLAFRGPRAEGQVGRHLNDDKDDNTLGNLAWGTPKQNTADMFANGYRVASGAAHGRAKWSTETVAEVRRLYDSGMRQKEIIARLGLPQTTVSRLCRRTSRKHS